MQRNTYARGIGIDGGDRAVPVPCVVILLAALAFGVWRSAGELQARVDQRQEAERISVAAAGPARGSLAQK